MDTARKSPLNGNEQDGAHTAGNTMSHSLDTLINQSAAISSSFERSIDQMNSQAENHSTQVASLTSSTKVSSPTQSPRINIVNFHHHFQSSDPASNENSKSCENSNYLPMTVSNKKSEAPLSSTVPEFLYQLTKMLTDDNKDIIEWVNGKIDVHNPPKLASDILHKYFRHSKYASFQRQLNNFCFRKLAGKGKMSPCSYINDNATPDIRSLLTIKRKKTSGPSGERGNSNRKRKTSTNGQHLSEQASYNLKISKQNSVIESERRTDVGTLYGNYSSPSSSATSAVGKGVKHCFNGFLKNQQPSFTHSNNLHLKSGINTIIGKTIEQADNTTDEMFSQNVEGSRREVVQSNLITNTISNSTGSQYIPNGNVVSVTNSLIIDSTSIPFANVSTGSMTEPGQNVVMKYSAPCTDAVQFNKKDFSLNSNTIPADLGESYFSSMNRNDARSPVLVSSGNSSEVLAIGAEQANTNNDESIQPTNVKTSMKTSTSLIDLAYIPTLYTNDEKPPCDAPVHAMTFIDFPHDYSTSSHGFGFDPL